MGDVKPRWPAELDRYSRQMLFEPLGPVGQQRLARSRALLVGVGALGTHQAATLVRAGVGRLTIVDRDFIELNNLQRQSLFDEQDIADNLPKAEAARRKLARINSAVRVDAVVADANHANIEQLAADADILLDGTDNFETRYLLNDLAVKTARPWVYGAAVGATGLEMAILPERQTRNAEFEMRERVAPGLPFRETRQREMRDAKCATDEACSLPFIPDVEFHTPHSPTACLRCMFEDRPPPQASPTCDTAGVLGPVVAMVAALQALDAIKILTGQTVLRKLTHIDGWAGRIAQLDVGAARADCPCCGRKQFDFLSGKLAGGAVTLCGRNAVQIAGLPNQRVDFAALARRLAPVTSAAHNAFMLKFAADGFGVTVFADGRAIITGTDNPAVARTVYARYVGG